MRTERATSAGGVVLAEPTADADVVLISRRTGSGALQWTLPKGTPEAGEDIEATALREVREETGLSVHLLGPLDVIDYWFVWTPQQTRYHKFVHYFLMLSTGGDLTDHDDEVEEARWFTPAAAVSALSFPNERRLLALVPDALATYAREAAGEGGP